tara:strand:+ start:1312 stop:1575 length:264 start_codon:yes stop_codon:yes gene_type:complete
MTKNKPALAKVKIRKGETIESLIRRFTRQLKKSGGLEDIKERGPGRRFKSKRDIRIEKEKASAKRRKQAQKRAKRKRNVKARQMKDV